jgi:predicted double-glycine peptidase
MYQTIIITRIDDDTLNYTISFAAISDYLSTHNIQSRAYRMDWDELRDALVKDFRPIIIHYQVPMAHFALLLHIERDYAFVADPARGFELVDRWTFMKRFSGNVILTASRVHQRNNKYISEVIAEKQNRLNRLQRVARLR